MEFRTLHADEIDCRVAQIDKTWCTVLLYKDARVDMNILDETVGSLNWQREHKELKGNIYCGISIWDDTKKQWVTKWDCGKETFSDSEKGESSDSFKRAGFNVGIGRELYTAPSIFITPRKDIKYRNGGKEVDEFYEYKDGKYTTKTRFWVELIDYDENKRITDLIIRDNKGNIRYMEVTKITEKKLEKIENELKSLEEKAEELDEKFDREKIPEHYNVKSGLQMTYKQMKDAIEILKKKVK